MQRGDYVSCGKIMGEHFNVYNIVRLASSLEPQIGFLAPEDNLKYAAAIFYKGKSYYWYNTIGFVGPAEGISMSHRAFDIWTRQ